MEFVIMDNMLMEKQKDKVY